MRTQVENVAQAFAKSMLHDYGAASGLARAKRLGHEYRHQPQWLMRAIEILEEANRNAPLHPDR